MNVNAENLQECLNELSEVVAQLQNANSIGDRSYAIESIMRLLKCISFLQMENCYDEEIEAVNENITLYYMHRAEINRIIKSISVLTETMTKKD